MTATTPSVVLSSPAMAAAGGDAQPMLDQLAANRGEHGGCVVGRGRHALLWVLESLWVLINLTDDR